MSYIVGLKINGVSSIICDTRVSFENGDGENTSLKSGRIFPGCIYGGAGNADSMRRFIKQCKIALTTSDKRLLIDYWSLFQKCIKFHIDEHTEYFELILASRHTGKTELYSFNSKDKIIREENNFISIGSGKKLLDEQLKAYIDNTKNIFIKQLQDNSWNIACYPYGYCLWLMEKARGYESVQLEQIGVGGYFHFSYQTNIMEARQDPSVYIINKAFGKTIYSYIYHITFEEASMIISCPDKNQRMLILDEAVWMGCGNFTDKEKQEYADRVYMQADEQPYYVFLGVGYADLEQRGHMLFHMTNKEDYVMTRDGKIDEKFFEQIKLNYTLTTAF